LSYLQVKSRDEIRREMDEIIDRVLDMLPDDELIALLR